MALWHVFCRQGVGKSFPRPMACPPIGHRQLRCSQNANSSSSNARRAILSCQNRLGLPSGRKPRLPGLPAGQQPPAFLRSPSAKPPVGPKPGRPGKRTSSQTTRHPARCAICSVFDRLSSTGRGGRFASLPAIRFIALFMAYSCSRGDWQLQQPVAMTLPTALSKLVLLVLADWNRGEHHSNDLCQNVNYSPRALLVGDSPAMRLNPAGRRKVKR